MQDGIRKFLKTTYQGVFCAHLHLISLQTQWNARVEKFECYVLQKTISKMVFVLVFFFKGTLSDFWLFAFYLSINTWKHFYQQEIYLCKHWKKQGIVIITNQPFCPTSKSLNLFRIPLWYMNWIFHKFWLIPRWKLINEASMQLCFVQIFLCFHFNCDYQQLYPAY